MVHAEEYLSAEKNLTLGDKWDKYLVRDLLAFERQLRVNAAGVY